jgi:hypothetical protein
MKKSLYLFIFLFSLQAGAQINAYFSNNPIWQVNSMCQMGYPCIQNETKIYYLNGDTLIQGLSYKKVFQKGQGSNNWMSNPPAAPGCVGSYFYIDTVPCYFMRSSGKQVYVRQLTENEEHMLYDFDLVLGDTLPITLNNYENDVTVIGVDSILTSDGYRKRFELAGNTWSQYLIEGIGHSKGLFEPMNVPLECGFELLCYSLNDSAFFPAVGPSCNIAVSVEDLEMTKHSISPNPFQDFTRIEVLSPVDHFTVKLYNMLGQEVEFESSKNGTSIDILRGNLLAGIYVYELRSYEHILGTGKIMVRD